MSKPAPRYWFRAKRYGWGWGLPCSWEGWLVNAAYAALLLLAFLVIDPDRNPVPFVATVVLLSLAMIGMCWWKGEPPRWRWGDQ
ncbi:MAG: hypothetical protein MUE46_07245 [Xanthomonadales bacterium]|jgi:hypothetical protein|nr:hypothetical protein [Xanthomonadales bacterium]